MPKHIFSFFFFRKSSCADHAVSISQTRMNSYSWGCAHCPLAWHHCIFEQIKRTACHASAHYHAVVWPCSPAGTFPAAFPNLLLRRDGRKGWSPLDGYSQPKLLWGLQRGKLSQYRLVFMKAGEKIFFILFRDLCDYKDKEVDKDAPLSHCATPWSQQKFKGLSFVSTLFTWELQAPQAFRNLL